MIKNVYLSSCKVAVIPVSSEWNFISVDTFSKNTQILCFMKIRPAEAELFHADGRTDMKKLMFAFAILQAHIRTFYYLSFTNP